jgi:membrane protein DedA with SNARE-associated domain/rhodanese-related sulfurtransferase
VPHSFAPLYSQLGLGLAVANVLLDQMGLPVPAVPTLVVAGAVAIDHFGWGTELFVGATLACLLPDAAWYVAGRIYGSRVLKMLCYLSLTPDSCVSDTQQRFARWGGNALVVAKFVPGLATIAPPMAGALRMSWPRFLGRSTLGAALWVGAYLGLGMLFHEQIDDLLPRVASYGGQAIAVVVALLAGYIGYKWWERRRFYVALRMARISVSELYEAMEAERAPLVVDVRSHGARAMEPRWIPGALHVPPDELSVHLGELPRDREIVLYCNCPNEASAAQAAKLLINHGFTRVRPLHGGLDAWVAAGYAVVTAPPAEADTRAA